MGTDVGAITTFTGPQHDLKKNETEWIFVSGSFYGFPPGYFISQEKKKVYFAKLKKWGEEVVEELS